MRHAAIEAVEKSQMKPEAPEVSVGDTVDVHTRIIEGSKERVQVFNGVVIQIKGTGIARSITVRRIVANEGVERIFPLHSPKVAKVEVKRHGHVRRAKLYYLRERVGKSRRLRDRRRGLGLAEVPDTGGAAAGTPAPGAGEAAGGQAPVQAEAGRKA